MKKYRFLIVMALVLVTAVCSWAGGPGWKQNQEFPVVTVNHLSYPSIDYKKTRDFYVDLLGFRVVWDDGTKAQVDIGPVDSPNSMYLTTGTPANAGRLAHYAFGLPSYWDQRTELGAELVRRGFDGVKPDGQAGFFVNSPSGYVQHFCVVKDPAMFPGAATPCAVYPSATCTAAYLKGLENLGSIPGPSGKGFTADYFKYIILHVVDADAESDFYTSLMGMGAVANRGDFGEKGDIWLRFGQNSLVIRPTDPSLAPFAVPYINEFGFVVKNYDSAKVKAELDRRGIAATPNAFGGWDFLDPNGLKISINGPLGLRK